MEAFRNTLTMTRAELRALLAHASTDETRPHLCALHYTPGSCPPEVFATDSHRLLVGACQGPDRVGDAPSPVSILRGTLDSAMRLARGAAALIRITFGPPESDEKPSGYQLTAPGHVSVQVYDSPIALQTDRPVGGFFCKLDPTVKPPPIDHIMASVAPDRAYGERSPFVAFNPSYLGDLKLVLAAAADTGTANGGVKLFAPRAPLDPVYLECGLWRGILMPMRPDEEPKGKPRHAVSDDADAIDGRAPEALPAKGKRGKGKRVKPGLDVANG